MSFLKEKINYLGSIAFYTFTSMSKYKTFPFNLPKDLNNFFDSSRSVCSLA